MPVKWKIFYALNIIIGLPSFVILLLLLVSSADRDQTRQDYLFLGIFLFSFLLMTINSFLNIVLLQRYYPDKLIPGNIKLMTTWSFILNVLITVVFLIGCIVTAIVEFGTREKFIENDGGKIGLAIIFLLTAIQTIILTMQQKLAVQIRRNHENSMHSLIDSIGQTPEAEN